jgi:hypothetical protein
MVRMFMIREAGLLGGLRAVPAPMHTFATAHSAN